ncbi:MAG: phosphatase PAP2 family protein [Bacteroidales bacterium]
MFSFARIYSVIAVLLLSTAIFSQTVCVDSLMLSSTKSVVTNENHLIKHHWLENFTTSRFYQITHAAVPLAVTSLIVKRRDDRYRSMRNDYVPRFDFGYDDYLQYSPGALVLGLKLAGVEGRSSWARMGVSDAFSIALCTGLVNSIKYSTKVMRPDGSTRNSFPSGHTAVAFMTATMLHKEYGMTRSPWYSIGGYSLALATGISRQLNNRHWVSDVMMGAAIGIFSTELGYFLADLIFKDRGIVRKDKDYRLYDVNHNPSFLGVYMGVNFLMDKRRSNGDHIIEQAEGNTAAIEGAWFFNRNWGIGSRFGVTGVRLRVDDHLVDESMNILSWMGGAYYSYPLSQYWALGVNLLGGYAHIPDYDEEFVVERYSGRFTWSSGFSVTYHPYKHLGLRGYLNYHNIAKTNGVSLLGYHMLMLGGSVNVMF